MYMHVTHTLYSIIVLLYRKSLLTGRISKSTVFLTFPSLKAMSWLIPVDSPLVGLLSVIPDSPVFVLGEGSGNRRCAYYLRPASFQLLAHAVMYYVHKGTEI